MALRAGVLGRAVLVAMACIAMREPRCAHGAAPDGRWRLRGLRGGGVDLSGPHERAARGGAVARGAAGSAGAQGDAARPCRRPAATVPKQRAPDGPRLGATCDDSSSPAAADEDKAGVRAVPGGLGTRDVDGERTGSAALRAAQENPGAMGAGGAAWLGGPVGGEGSSVEDDDQGAEDEELDAQIKHLSFKDAVLPLLINSARNSGYTDPEALVQTFVDSAQGRSKTATAARAAGADRTPAGAGASEAAHDALGQGGHGGAVQGGAAVADEVGGGYLRESGLFIGTPSETLALGRYLKTEEAIRSRSK